MEKASEHPGDANCLLGETGALGVTARLAPSKKSMRTHMHMRLPSTSVKVNYFKDCTVFKISIFTDPEEARRLQARAPFEAIVSDLEEASHVQALGRSLGVRREAPPQFSITLHICM